LKTRFIVVGVVIVIIVVLVIVVFVMGSRVPESHVVSRSIRLHRPLPDVYATVCDFGGSSKWRTDVKSVEMLETSEKGKTQFRENGRNDIVTYEVVDDVQNQRIVTRIVDRDLGYSGSWTYVFSKNGDDTVVTITENGEVPNVAFRFMSHYVFGHTSTIDAYLKALARHFGDSAAPQDPETLVR
jgi:uncharacterized membrane protein